MPELPVDQFDGSHSLEQMNALIQHYLHCDPDTLADEEWVRAWRKAQFLVKLLKPLSI